ncbi:MAG TPA: prolyl oligopeptidase family serine peptidase, partial [Planctomycetota bacterium]
MPLLLLLALTQARVDEMTASLRQQTKTIPGPGVPIPEADRAELRKAVDDLGGANDPDNLIVRKAIDWALRYDEFLDAKDVAAAKRLLTEKPKPGLATHAYRSKIDGSLQPYGMVLPANYEPGRKYRLDFWLHGRDEKLTELRFLDQRRRSPGEFTPPDTLVLHLYGRFCNASKFAGEVDLFEALDDAKKRYSIDEERICVRGFSMGGASAWHIGAHHAGLWAAVAPGAGFAETPVYARMFDDPVKPTDYEQKLWHWYNATDYAINLRNTTVIAYSGELDKQKAAADTMVAAAKAEGFEFPHVIGPKTEHKYEPEAKKEVARLVDAAAAKGRTPSELVRFTTWTLRYPTMKWLTVHGLEKHWERARLEVALDGGRAVVLKAENVTSFRIAANIKQIDIDGRPLSSDGWCSKLNGRWEAKPLDGLRKRPGLQGPIDDAFMDGFVVAAQGQGFKEAAEAWRRTMRGDFPAGADDGKRNVVYFGDYTHPKVAEIAKRAGFTWDASGVSVHGKTYPGHTLALIYPDGNRYIVLNSGFTWAENAAASNSRHVPLLPDWAIIDPKATGKMSQRVAAAGFFDEEWKL